MNNECLRFNACKYLHVLNAELFSQVLLRYLLFFSTRARAFSKLQLKSIQFYRSIIRLRRDI